MSQDQKRHAEPNTSILFLSEDDVLEVPAEVMDHGDKMVIDIPRCAESEPYLVIGKRVEHFYAGVDTYQGEPVDVVARWTRLGDVFVGLWREDGVDYLFKFDPPRDSSI